MPALGLVVLGLILLAVSGCGSSGSKSVAPHVVTSLADTAQPPPGVTTLRSAIEKSGPGDTITFAPSLDSGTILLSLVGSPHSVLKGEVYSGTTFQGYQERDYGPSALYARKDLVIDASGLPNGITIAWGGGDANRARVLAVYGNLTLKNVTITSGHSSAEAITGGAQPYTLARGGGLAVWGTARLDHSTVSGNRCTGDETASRDRGTYGGGIYANGLELKDCTISGNAVLGYGAAGGGIYSVGGADNQNGRGNDTLLTRSAVTGNRVTAQHAYGGGIFTLSGGPANLATMHLNNCTIARNLVEDNAGLPETGQYYYRGGGIYMGGGSLSVVSCTVAENEATGHPAVFGGKPNMGGGGVAATIGNAHTVENVWLQHSIVVGNKLNGAAEDWFTGSLLNFYSHGYNLLGVIDFSQILVPVPDWLDLSRKHYPKAGDREGVPPSQALALTDAHFHGSAISAGTDAGQPAVLWYPPAPMAVDQVPVGSYTVDFVSAGYRGFGSGTDDFLNHVLLKLRTDYALTLGSDFGANFGDMTGVTWYGPAVTWPTDPANLAWITFWRDLDMAIGDRLGMVRLGDDFWGSFTSGAMGDHVWITIARSSATFRLADSDQRGSRRPSGVRGDIGAFER